MTSSAMASSGEERLSPSDFAVLRLMTNSNFVGCWTGISEGLAPSQYPVDKVGGAPEQS